jgi:hypothetical protein
MPDRDAFIRITKSIATLDAILSPEWDGRYYSFDSQWNVGEEMASMRDGCGGDWKAHITEAGIILFGLAHESDTFLPGNPWPGVLDDVPDVFQSSVTEPAFDTSNLSYCIWLRFDSAGWQMGDIAFPVPATPDPDGSIEHLAIFDGNPATYRDWAADYYETDVSLPSVEAIYGGDNLTPQLVKSLNPSIELEETKEEIEKIGYP